MPTTEALPRAQAPAERRVRGASRTVYATIARAAVRSGGGWGLVFGGYVVASISGYAVTYQTAGARRQLARSLGTNAGLQALLGPARHLETVTGFAAWRTIGVLSVVGAVWGLMAGTRLLRGNEEAGRWELLLAGHTTRRGACAQAVAGLATGWATLACLTAIFTIADAQTLHPAISPRSSLYLALALTASAALFLTAGALAGQLARTRRRAATLAGGALTVAYLLRVVADAGRQLQWLRWVSPLGWVEELRPLTGSRPLALLPLAALTLALAGVAIELAGRRDLGAGLLPEADSASARTRLLTGPAGLAVRELRPVVAAWIVAVIGISFVEGLVARSAAGALAGSAAAQTLLQHLGSRGTGTEAYLGLSFILVAVILCLVAAALVAANRDEEGSGRLDNLLARPTARSSWLAGRLGIEAAALTACGAAAGLAAWAGAVADHAPVRLPGLVLGGLTTVPPALLVLGAGALAQGALPRRAAAAAYGLVVWSFLVDFVGATLRVSHWVLDTSVLRHMAPVPAVAPAWTGAAGLVGLGAVAALVGVGLFRHRDLAGP